MSGEEKRLEVTPQSYQDDTQRRARKEEILQIGIERLRDFQNHPFKVRDDKEMSQLTESIKHFGILNPLTIRPVQDGTYEIISGHRRKHAAKQLGMDKLPAIIRKLKKEEAIISMVDANLQRESILPSEKAFAYKMKYDALKRTSGRQKKSIQKSTSV